MTNCPTKKNNIFIFINFICYINLKEYCKKYLIIKYIFIRFQILYSSIFLLQSISYNLDLPRSPIYQSANLHNLLANVEKYIHLYQKFSIMAINYPK